MQHIFVGDVQGCSEELAELVARIEARFGDDHHLHMTGDLVNRGPGNLEALEIVRTRTEAGRASYVLGNHELALLMIALELRPLGERDSVGDVLASRERDDWIDWLRTRPLIETGEIAGSTYLMVHAAAHPDWELSELEARVAPLEVRLAAPDRDVARSFLAEDPARAGLDSERDLLARLTRCRSVGPGGTWSSEEPDASSEPWHVVWARHQHTYGVVYGHWARQGLHIAPGLRGLDTGCVHHDRGSVGYLTAWLPGLQCAGTREARANIFEVPDEDLLQVRARRRYYDH